MLVGLQLPPIFIKGISSYFLQSDFFWGNDISLEGVGPFCFLIASSRNFLFALKCINFSGSAARKNYIPGAATFWSMLHKGSMKLRVWICQLRRKKGLFFQKIRSPSSVRVRSSPLDMFYSIMCIFDFL